MSTPQAGALELGDMPATSVKINTCWPARSSRWSSYSIKISLSLSLHEP